jgi:uncharacterized protein
MTRFSIDLGGLPPGHRRVRIESSAHEIGLDPSRWAEPVIAVLDIERNGDRISVRGKLEGRARLECVRCLGELELPLEADLEVFAERAGSGPRVDEEELERDDYMMFHDGRHLDLTERAREALLVELPMAPHCREDCAGLCQRCGADLNQGPCECVPSQA